MLRKLAFLAIFVVILAAAYGAAAALSVDGGVVQAGGDDTLACDTDGVTTQWETQVSGDGKFHIRAVEIEGIHENCMGKFVLVALMKSPTEIKAFMRVPTAISGTTAKADQCFAGTGWAACGGTGPAVEDVNSVQVLFKGAFTDFDAP